MAAPEGWYPVKDGSGERYWDGAAWTEQRRAFLVEPPPVAPQPPSGSSPAATQPIKQSNDRLTVAQRVSAVAIVVTIVAAFLPWVSLFGISKLGVEGDGVITLILAIVGAVLLLLSSSLIGKPRATGRIPQVVLLVLAVLVALVGLLDMNGVAAMGLYLTLFAGVAWIVGAVWQLRLPKTASS